VKALHGRAILITLLVICQSCPTFEPGISRCRNYGSETFSRLGLRTVKDIYICQKWNRVLTRIVFDQDLHPPSSLLYKHSGAMENVSLSQEARGGHRSTMSSSIDRIKLISKIVAPHYFSARIAQTPRFLYTMTRYSCLHHLHQLPSSNDCGPQLRPRICRRQRHGAPHGIMPLSRASVSRNS
jgi:hypothetical protein